MEKLSEVRKMPLLLSSSQMLKNTPIYYTVTSDVGNDDIVQGVKVLENGLEGFIKNQNEKFMRLTELVGCIGQGQSSQAAPIVSQSGTPPVSGVPVRPIQDSVAGVGRARLDSATKKRKVGDDYDEEQTDKDSGLWIDVVKKNTNIKGEISDSQPPKVDGWRKQKTSFGTAISGNEDQT